ncbi:hypothetical protein [Sphingosinicella sp.]|uniref:hypothetical protein n=1 Tax=Sphingosinicella sp. TaxID=1917971 RepID=UPI0025E61406|nr:hypothetical protein [Sphingosinicella sp.]
MAGHQIKRWLYLVHRWIGIATCLLFVLWFASGLVMLYVPFPSLEDQERIAGLSPIAWEQLNGDVSLARSASEARQMVLEMRGDRPVWRIDPWEGSPFTLWASTGLAAEATSRREAERIAATFGRTNVEAMEAIQTDQWVVASRYDSLRPLWKAKLSGDAGRILYVSSSDGAVVLDTDARERFWNWLGSVPHWLYPRALRENQPLWRQVVLWSSGPCILVALTGTWIGVMRLRAGKRRFGNGRMTPYAGWMKWHHVSGLVGSLFLILWILSGWLSVDPGRVFSSEGIRLAARRDYAGQAPLMIPDLARIAAIAPDARRVAISAAAGRAFVRVQGAGGEDKLFDATTLEPLQPDLAAISASAPRLVPDAKVVSITKLTRPDAYWYAVKGELRLPVLRVAFGDPASSWVHIAADTGEVVGESDARRRVYRWLFDLFHRWDLNLLLQTPLARELLIWAMSIMGLITSVAGVVIGWRRLRRPRTPLVHR